MPGYYVLKPSSGQFHFNLHAGNHEVILTSERYTTKQSAKGGIEACKQNSSNDAQYKRLTASNGKPYFTLNAANGQVIGVSELYSSSSARETGINSVKANGPVSPIQDQA